MMSWHGLDVGSVLDRSVSIDENGSLQLRASGVPATVVRCRADRRPFAGTAATSSVEAQGDSIIADLTPEVVRVHQLWHRLVASGVPLSRSECELFASHLRDLVGSDDREAVLLIPDPLTEAQRDTLLGVARPARLDVRLLWRPIAVLLGLGRSLSVEAARRMHGQRALVIHLGIEAAYATIVTVEIDTATALITPIRDGEGRVSRRWYARHLARDIAELEASRLGGSDTLVDALCDRTGRAWSALLGLAPVPALVRGSSSRRHLLTGAPPAPNDIRGEIEAALAELLDGLRGPWTIAFIEGPLVSAPIGRQSCLGDLTRQQLMRRASSSIDSVRVLESQSASAAEGAAEYARRLQRGLPTYFDFLPRIEINAVRDHHVEFVDLVQGQSRIAGDQPYRKTVSGYLVGAGTDTLLFALAFERDDGIRGLQTKLPIKPRSSVPVSLVVEQRPGSGFARVEVRPEPRNALGTGTILLDWATLKPTGETRAQALGRLQKEIGFAYPDLVSVTTDLRLWQSRNLTVRIRQFTDTPLAPVDAYANAAEQIRKLLTPGPLPFNLAPGDRSRYAAVDRSGKPPSALKVADEAAFRAMLTKVAIDFETVSHWPSTAQNQALQRQLYLIGAWCYAAAPRRILDFFCEQLRHPHPARWAVQAMGRCFSQADDIERFLVRAKAAFSIGQPTMDWIKATAQILTYREEAVSVLTDTLACLAVIRAYEKIADSVRTQHFQQKFNCAVLLLLGLLRFRKKNRAFLLGGRADPVEPSVRAALKAELERACELAPALRQRAIKEVLEFLEGRGTNQLIAEAFAED